MTCPFQSSMCGSSKRQTLTNVTKTVQVATVPGTNYFTFQSVCYYEFTADNETFRDTVNYQYDIKFTLNYYSGVEVNFYSGTSLADASD